jgi:transglutaminase-like putative cysteine protease
MARGWWSWAAALLCAGSAVGVSVARHAILGPDLDRPRGAGVWRITWAVTGTLTDKDTVVQALPPDFRRQHVYDESWKSDELSRPEGRGARGPREKTVWKPRPGVPPDKGYRLTYSFRVVLGAHNPSPAMGGRAKQLDAAPKGPADRTLKATPRAQSDRREVRDLAETLAAVGEPAQQFRAFFDHVAALPFQNGPGQTALDCLRAGGGDDAGKSRLLVALCRAKGIPARVVVGMVLNPNAPPALHRWVEAWMKTADRPEPHWVPADPAYGHFGNRKWPGNYLVVRVGDGPIAAGTGVPRVSLFARPLPDEPAAASGAQAFWRAVSLANLPPAEQHLARFLVLLPVAAAVVSVFRVVVGIRTFGVFSPALLGLVFRDLRNLGWGLGIFAATVLVGWVFRKLLDRFHLLLIPRSAVLLTLIVVFLLVVLILGARGGVQVSGYLSLFPLIILTHMVERFWTMEAEDGSWSSFKTLFGTLAVSAVVAVALNPDAVGRTVFRFPEVLGGVVAVLMLLGRYTGYRVTELYRFRDVIEPPAEPPKGPPAGAPPGEKKADEKRAEEKQGETAPAV